MKQVSGSPRGSLTLLLALSIIPLAAGPAVQAGECTSSGHPYRFLGSGWLRFPGSPETPAGADTGDLDGNGVPDAVVSFPGHPPVLRTYLADAPFCFQLAHELETTVAGDVFVAELTGDAYPDAVVFQQEDAGNWTVFQGGEGGSFEILASHDVSHMEIQGQLLVHDTDGDGHVDLVVAGRPSFIAYGPAFSEVTSVLDGSDTGTGVTVIDATGSCSCDGWSGAITPLAWSGARATARLQLPATIRREPLSSSPPSPAGSPSSS